MNKAQVLAFSSKTYLNTDCPAIFVNIVFVTVPTALVLLCYKQKISLTKVCSLYP